MEKRDKKLDLQIIPKGHLIKYIYYFIYLCISFCLFKHFIVYPYILSICKYRLTETVIQHIFLYYSVL